MEKIENHNVMTDLVGKSDGFDAKLFWWDICSNGKLEKIGGESSASNDQSVRIECRTEPKTGDDERST